MGRPPVPKDRAKSTLLSVRFSDGERAALDAAAVGDGLRLSEWVRRKLLALVGIEAASGNEAHEDLQRMQQYWDTVFAQLEQDAPPVTPEPSKNPDAVALGKLGGAKGGKARAEKLSPERRKQIAQEAAAKRWGPRAPRHQAAEPPALPAPQLTARDLVVSDREIAEPEERRLGRPALPPLLPAPTRPDVSRDVRRSGRHRDVRASTLSNRFGIRELELQALRDGISPEPHWKPKTRGECMDGHRPCPYVSCRWHLFLDVSSIGSLKLNFPDIEPDELTESCALDVADRGGDTLENVGTMLNLTRERIRQLETKAMATLQKRLRPLAQDFDVAGPVGKRRLPIVTEPDDPEETAELVAALESAL